MRTGVDFVMAFLKILPLLLLTQAGLGWGLRVSGVLVPPVVVSGSTVELVCNYHHSSDRPDPLYSIKWYRDVNQFYEYIPRRNPPVRVYELPHIHVDEARSGRATVVLTGVTRETSGSYRCEVMGDKPFFETDDHAVNMTVVDVPQWGPQITGVTKGSGINPGTKVKSGSRVKPGSLVAVRCLLGASDPPADMGWAINGEEAPPHAFIHRTSQQDPQGQMLQVSKLQVTATEEWLERGYMTITCHAHVSSVYHTTANLTLVNSEGPIPYKYFYSGASPVQGAAPPMLVMMMLVFPLLMSL